MRPAPNSPTTDLRLAAIDHARRIVIQEREALTVNGLSPWVQRSWQRCLSFGFQPGEAVHFDLLSQAEMHRTMDANRQLVQTARPLLEKLGQAISGTDYFAILTNANGVVVDVNGQIDRSDRRASLITRIGVDLSESKIGTNAIGSALAEHQPVWLHRGEHFFNETSHYSCAGAPLFGPNGACVGMLDVTGIDAVERPELKHLVAQCASKIENALLLSKTHSLMIRLNWPGNTMGSDGDGMLCLDTDGMVMGANTIARQMVPNLTTPNLGAVHVSELFGVPAEFLFDAVRRSDPGIEIPLWSGLRLQALPVERRYEERQTAGAVRPMVAQQRPLKDIETALIHKAVEQARGNVTAAARALGISRATVYRKIGQKIQPR
ncbi:helix-turn-helix domain-containing protein [Rhodoferax sp. PAMC 29310]|uniref:helix-turn-helix domain-containing protein n=1 Tax=Rhodoferax sp. PAMC 29310 TaxID=2822760 RepID=UPI001B3262B7|nr:helix-turn-helix domain-containing protein [Rhodoferax sp. PAMC 29310]